MLINLLLKRSTTQTTELINKNHWLILNLEKTRLYKLCYIHSQILFQLGFILFSNTNKNNLKNQSKSESVLLMSSCSIVCRFELQLLTILEDLGATFGSKNERGIQADAPSDATSFNFRLRGASRIVVGRFRIDLWSMFEKIGIIVSCFCLMFHPTKPSTNKPINKPTFQPTNPSTSNLSLASDGLGGMREA